MILFEKRLELTVNEMALKSWNVPSPNDEDDNNNNNAH